MNVSSGKTREGARQLGQTGLRKRSTQKAKASLQTPLHAAQNGPALSNGVIDLRIDNYETELHHDAGLDDSGILSGCLCTDADDN